MRPASPKKKMKPLAASKLPIGMGKTTRGVELTSLDDFNGRQLAAWMTQSATMAFFGGKKRY